MLAAAGGVLVAVAVAIVLAVTLTGKSSHKPVAVRVDLSMLQGIPQHGLTLGNQLARVAMTEYVDTSCPVCQDYAAKTFPTLAAQYVRPGKVKLEARLVAFVGPSSERGRDLVLAASRQGKAWQMLELLYQNQGDETKEWLTDEVARAIGTVIPGLDVDRLLRDASSAPVLAQATTLDQEMQADSISATPTFILTTPDGKRHLLGAGNFPASTFATALDRALAG